MTESSNDAPPAPRGSIGDDVMAALTVSLRGLVVPARDRLVERVRDVPAADLDALADEFAADLGARLVRLAGRTLAAEFERLQQRGDLAGAGGPQRFAAFVAWLDTGLDDILTRHPVLGRRLSETASTAVQTHAELLERYAVDRSDLVRALLGGGSPGALTGVHAGLGDPHHGGRSVTRLTFADGRHVVYKPRGIAAYAMLAELTAWLNRAVPGLDLRTAATLARSGYGYAEFVAHLPLDGPASAERFYRRMGALLALLHAVRAVDLHHENLIACGEHPVLIDAEALFHPALATPVLGADPARRMLSASVYRTSLLPTVTVGPAGIVDCSGLAGRMGSRAVDRLDWELSGHYRDRLRPRPRDAGAGGLNLPRLGGRELDPGDYDEALRAGLRAGYDAISAGRESFQQLLDSAANLEVRVVFRPTLTYATLLERAADPHLLRDDAGPEQALTAALRQDPMCRPLVPYELTDLRRGDIPVFTAVPGRRDVWSSTGERLAGLLPTTGLDDASAVLAGMGTADRRDQEWIVSATLAARQPADGHRAAGALAGPVTGHEAGPDRLLTAACALADQILARGVTDGERVNWLGLEVVDGSHWMVLPMGASLATGYLGVALFLAQLAELTGIDRFRDTAQRAAHAAVPLCRTLAERPELAVHVGTGGYQGFGGICYSLARLATLLNDPGLREGVRDGVTAAATAVAAPGPPGVANGIAGCLAAMRAVHAELALESAADLARVCADRLDTSRTSAGGLAAGFADGRAGVAWARRDDAAVAALSLPDTADHGWCGGAAGIVSVRGVQPGDDPARIIRRFAQRPVLRDLSLCHGELGVVEALVVLAAFEPDRSVQRALRWRAGLVLDAIERYGPCCGTPDGVATPGLLNGLAGIGYGLLRLGFPAQVPSVLLLKPGRPGK
ncbi:type 2 lanthipeptide synthetase LanM family protein [Micromonospora sp. NPDC049282]|uniref:type 2 lanthipeptide synthetase LanM family protein n=1 Tax=Micromonospora sp. NPDC049282 TaxID=3364269 RepID=UPI003720C6B9